MLRIYLFEKMIKSFDLLVTSWQVLRQEKEIKVCLKGNLREWTEK